MSSPAPSRILQVREIPIELAQLLKFAGLAESGGSAKQAIVNAQVKVNGVVEKRKGRKLQAGDQVTYQGQTLTVQQS